MVSREESSDMSVQNMAMKHFVWVFINDILPPPGHGALSVLSKCPCREPYMEPKSPPSVQPLGSEDRRCKKVIEMVLQFLANW